MLIERLLTELFEKNPLSNNDLLSAYTSTENSQSLYDLDNSRENILQAKSIIEDIIEQFTQIGIRYLIVIPILKMNSKKPT